jgi:Dolichyl-phosphate-mannose-protein mannosyltransferase
MTHRFARLRRFHFNLPQRIAAGMLLLFLGQGLWLTAHQSLSDRDYQYARCGREMWERPSALTGYFTTCGNIRDGVLAYRVAGLPLTLNLLAQRGLDRFRKPEDRVVQTGDPPNGSSPMGRESAGELTTWELRHQMTHVLLLLRLPFLACGCILGAGLWWVTRRLYGNMGGYIALALYCFSPAVLRACVTPNPEIFAALGVYGGVYTCIGVAHAMQGPRRKWRPRIVLLTVIFGIAAAAHIAALPVAALLGLAFMLWVAESRRSQVLPILLLASVGALLLVFAGYGFSPDAFSYLFRSAAGFLWFSIDPARRFFSMPGNAGITLAAASAAVLYLLVRRSRYFGNTTPLLCALVLMALITTGVPSSPWLWALPFLLTFIGGVFADAFEGPRGRWARAAGGSLVALQVIFCVLSLPRLL